MDNLLMDNLSTDNRLKAEWQKDSLYYPARMAGDYSDNSDNSLPLVQDP
jgi:hypothetical protein